ncbi:hypothetical protein D9M71_564010 [compost metagenome]
MQGDARTLVQLGFAEGQRLGIAAAEVFGEVHTVVGAQRFLAEHLDAVAVQRAARHQLLDTVVTDHAVADDDQRFQIVEGSVHGKLPANHVFCGDKKRRLEPEGPRRLCLFVRGCRRATLPGAPL